MFNYHLYTQGLLLVVWGDSRKTAMICSLKPFSFPPGGLLPSNPMLVVRICKVRARDILIQGDSSWQSSGEGGTRSLQGASSQVPKGYLGYFRGHLGLWEECPALGRVFLEGWGFSLLPHPHPYLRERDAASAHQPGLMRIVLPLEGDCLTKFEKLPSIFGLLAPKDFFFLNILSLLYNFSWPENSVINNTWPRRFFLTSH